MRFDFDVMQSLADQGLISDPKGWAASVRRTPKWMAGAKAVVERQFVP